MRPPLVVTALIILFSIGVVASLISAIALCFPGSFLEQIWRLNPRAREGFRQLGGWSILIMIAVAIACIIAVIGLVRARLWGYHFVLVLLTMNLIADFINVLTGSEPRAIVGIPIVVVILIYFLRKRTRQHFTKLNSNHLDAQT